MGEQPKTPFLKTWIPILIGVGGILSGAISFYFQSVYQPEHQPRTLNVGATLEKVGENKSLTTIRGTFKLKNISKGRSEVLAGYYNVWGTRIAPEDDVGPNAFAEQVRTLLPSDQYPYTQFARHYSQATKWTTIAVRKLWGEPEQAWLDSDLEYSVEYHVYVPPRQYDLVRSQVRLLYTKLNNRKSISAKWFVGDGGIWASPCKKLADFAKDPEKCDEIDGNLWNRFELGEIDSVSEISLLPSDAKR